jgi:hypothetical protein
MEFRNKRPGDAIRKATEGIRTLDPPLTKRLLYRLSYGGKKMVRALGIIPEVITG